MKQILAKFFGISTREEQSTAPSPSSSRCLVLRERNPEYASSPEFQFLESYINEQIRMAFGSITLDYDTFDYVLWIGDDKILLTADSIARMKERVDRGCDHVVPARLDSVMNALEESPPSALRQYEVAEQNLIKVKERWTQPSPGLVSLVSAKTFRKAVAERSFQEVIGNWAERRPSGSDVTYEGICYQFVDYYGQPREDIVQFIPADAKEVLEIGCARGLTGKLLKERLGCRVTGVELNSSIAEYARQHLDRVIVGDVESLVFDQKYDAVVATELFEHLQHPMDFLINVRSVLKPGGCIVLTVPNVGHWSIVEDLLQGRWDYLPMGILCYTHLRFFTYRTIGDWIEQAGFTKYEITRQKTDLPERFNVLSENMELDCENLSTSGFYVVIRA